jgi:hypothetical protein
MRVNQFAGDTRQFLGILRALPMLFGKPERGEPASEARSEAKPSGVGEEPASDVEPA